MGNDGSGTPPVVPRPAPAVMENLFDKSFEELTGILSDMDTSSFRLDQLLKWVYVRGAGDFMSMSDMPASLREYLAVRLDLNPMETVSETHTGDGTSKYLLKLEDGSYIESVLMPEEGRYTLCISTQTGCSMGCRFCETGSMSSGRNLSRGEILAQVAYAVRQVRQRVRLRNLVFMGMGEPLMNLDELLPALAVILDERAFNFSPRRVTVSTCGWLPGLRRLGESGIGVNLAVSLNAGDDETRSSLMPVNRKYPLAELMAALRAYPLKSGQRVTFEYVLMAGINDRIRDARNLAGLLRGVPAKVNLIPFNETSSEYRAPDSETVSRFCESLSAAGLTATVRRSRGADIGAACGQLAGKKR